MIDENGFASFNFNPKNKANPLYYLNDIFIVYSKELSIVPSTGGGGGGATGFGVLF
jgi:hypothetical protein